VPSRIGPVRIQPIRAMFGIIESFAILPLAQAGPLGKGARAFQRRISGIAIYEFHAGQRAGFRHHGPSTFWANPIVRRQS
jgi:hypothetical protein